MNDGKPVQQGAVNSLFSRLDEGLRPKHCVVLLLQEKWHNKKHVAFSSKDWSWLSQFCDIRPGLASSSKLRHPAQYCSWVTWFSRLYDIRPGNRAGLFFDPRPRTRHTDLEVESRSFPDESFFHLLLHHPEIILDTWSFANLDQIVAVGENDRLQISFRVKTYQVCRTCISDIDTTSFQSAHNTT